MEWIFARNCEGTEQLRCFLFQLVQIRERILPVSGEHCIHVPDHVPEPHRLLEHVFPGTPDIVLFHCLEIRKELIFCTQFVDRGKFPVDRTVVDQDIRVLL